MYTNNADLLTLSDIEKAHEILKSCPQDQFTRTSLTRADSKFRFAENFQLFLKQENTQVTGSFKVRGTITLLKHLPPGYGTDDHKLVTMSAGNFGKAFAYLASQMGLKGLVLMPDTAPDNRESLIRSYGLAVERVPTADLVKEVDRHCIEEGMLFMHPFDDIHLIAGHGTIGLEILEALPEPDVVLVGCGGGGSLAGTASAIKLSGRTSCRIYGVEPQGSRTMYESFKAEHPVTMDVGSVAAGLSPPFAGSNCFRHCREHVDDILLVSDEEIVESMFVLIENGFPVEPSGAAAFAALYTSKVPDVSGRKVVVVLTGSNVSAEELEVLAQIRHKDN